MFRHLVFAGSKAHRVLKFVKIKSCGKLQHIFVYVMQGQTDNKKGEAMLPLSFLQTVLAEECCGIEVGGKVRI